MSGWKACLDVLSRDTIVLEITAFEQRQGLFAGGVIAHEGRTRQPHRHYHINHQQVKSLMPDFTRTGGAGATEMGMRLPVVVACKEGDASQQLHISVVEQQLYEFGHAVDALAQLGEAHAGEILGT